MKVNKIVIIAAAFILLFIAWQIGSAYVKNREAERERIEELQKKKYSDLNRQVDEFFSKGEKKRASAPPVRKEEAQPRSDEKKAQRSLEPRVYTNEDIRIMNERRMEQNSRRVVPMSNPGIRLKTLPRFEKPKPDKSNRQRLNGMFKNARDKFKQTEKDPGFTTEGRSKKSSGENSAD